MECLFEHMLSGHGSMGNLVGLTIQLLPGGKWISPEALISDNVHLLSSYYGFEAYNDRKMCGNIL